MKNMIKTGCFRKINRTNNTVSYIPFREYNSWNGSYKQLLKNQFDAGEISLYCACSAENDLELSVTANHVIRVKNNRQQDMHMDSCPKSVHYAQWSEEACEKSGIRSSEDDQVVFRLTLPSSSGGSSSSSSSSGSSASSSGSSPKNHYAGILETAVTLNKLAWEKQTYSIKKEIGLAHKEKRSPEWKYKDKEQFIRLMFGVANEVMASVRGQKIPFIQLCYRRDSFFSCSDRRRQWFIFAEILNISEIKPERKYQYITVKMPSRNSASKAAVRVDTQAFLSMYQDFESIPEGTHRILAGYVCRRFFPASGSRPESDWIQLTKGCILLVNDYGLYVENAAVSLAADYLCRHRILFTRPFFPLENYGNLIPSFCIPQLRRKDILLDIGTKRQLARRSCFANEENEEFDCRLLCTDDSFLDSLSSLLSDLRS